jgi:hypothetical protein
LFICYHLGIHCQGNVCYFRGNGPLHRKRA